MDLTDKQWNVLEPLIPDPPQREDGRGRPWRDPRDVLNGILRILRTGAPWKDLPERYPPYQPPCHRRFQKWIEEGVLGSVLETLAQDLQERGRDRSLGVLHRCYVRRSQKRGTRAAHELFSRPPFTALLKVLDAGPDDMDKEISNRTLQPVIQWCGL